MIRVSGCGVDRGSRFRHLLQAGDPAPQGVPGAWGSLLGAGRAVRGSPGPMLITLARWGLQSLRMGSPRSPRERIRCSYPLVLMITIINSPQPPHGGALPGYPPPLMGELCQVIPSLSPSLSPHGPGCAGGEVLYVVAIDTRDDIDYIIITSKGLRNVYTRADGFINKALMYLIKKR
jgi:hypothetical protein